MVRRQYQQVLGVTEVAVIGPPSTLHLIGPAPIQMALAHVVLEDRSYAEWYRGAHNRGDYVIMDNGAAEDERLSLEDVIRAAELCGADEIVIPDVLGDAEQSIVLAEYTANYLWRHWAREAFNWMIVPHGRDLLEWIECYGRMLQYVHTIGANTVGVPKYIEGMNGEGGRAKAVQLLCNANIMRWGRDIHLLGVHSEPFRELEAAVGVFPHIRSIDTCAPIAYAQQGRMMDDTPRESMRWDAGVDEQHEVTARVNIEGYRRWGRQASFDTTARVTEQEIVNMVIRENRLEGTWSPGRSYGS